MISIPVKTSFVSCSSGLVDTTPEYSMPNTSTINAPLLNPPALNTRVRVGDDILIALATDEKFDNWSRIKPYNKGDKVLYKGIIWEAQVDFALYPSSDNSVCSVCLAGDLDLYYLYGVWNGDGTSVTNPIGGGNTGSIRHTYTKGTKFSDHYVDCKEDLDSSGNVTGTYCSDVYIVDFDEYPIKNHQASLSYTVAGGKLYHIDRDSFLTPGTGDADQQVINISGWYKLSLNGTELIAEKKRNELRAIGGISSSPSLATAREVTYTFSVEKVIDCIFVKTNAKIITVSFGSGYLVQTIDVSSYIPSFGSRERDYATFSFYFPQGYATFGEQTISLTKDPFTSTVGFSAEAGKVKLEDYGTKPNIAFGIVDYSVSEKNIFGVLERVERAKSITISTEAEILVQDVSKFAIALTSLGGSMILFDVKKGREDVFTTQNFAGCGIGYLSNAKVQQSEYMGAVDKYATLTLDFEERV